ncbi:response regulator transcription factor [Acidipila sp. EB88]|uniref:response regulator n=1 Tax=Acidipila sp. EB88 TaxID=2305226 RepID=UPI000F5DF32E|nr:response regulator transcription factor [Acidipila sp. EB88]RRA48788.1 DNA-binding response regulator [Acidipila sp. EB88]
MTQTTNLQRPPAIRVVLADDHPVVRIGVRNLLTAHGNFQVIGEAENGTQAVAATVEQRPDVLLLDVQMPQTTGFDIVRQVMTAVPQTKILLLTGSIQAEQLAEAFTAGARGIVLKSALAEQIATALIAVMNGFYWADGKRIEHLAGVLAELRTQVQQESTERFHLTRRELEVVGLIVKGLSNREIAKQFKLSEETVKRHLSNTFEKLKLSTRLELAIFAIAHKLVPPSEAQ